MILKKITLLAFLPLIVAAAMAAPATPPYFCGFEDDAENAEWVTWGGSTVARMKHSSWKAGEAAHYIGDKGMYITDPEIAEDNTHSFPKNSGYTVSVYRKVSLEADQYTISLDYRCPTEMLSVSMLRQDTLNANTIQTQTGADYAPAVGNSILEGMRDMKSVKWSHASVLYNAPAAGDYLLVITYRTSSGPDLAFGAAVDNVEIVKYQNDETACDYPITGLRLEYEDATAILTWRGNADSYEVMCYDPDGPMNFRDTVPDLGAIDSCRIPIETVIPGVYQFMVRGLGCNDNGASTGWGYSRVDITTRIAVACPEVHLLSPFFNMNDDQKYVYPSCEGTDTIPLRAKVVAGGGEIRGYRVDEVLFEDCPFPFNLNDLPAEQRNQITTITRDDYWDTRRIDLPFTVCFFNATYRQALVGANGLVTFDRFIQPGSSCAWSLSGQPDIPSPNFQYKNCIMGVYQDYDPGVSSGNWQIWYGVLGEFPCRKMVVCWNEVSMFSNPDVKNSSMIVMYEGTNVIDVYVKNRDLSPDNWNDNRGIIGIINADGSDGIAAPGRNTSAGTQNGRAWHARNEAWRFSPIATPEYTVTWYKGAFNNAQEIDAYVATHPREHIVLDATDSLDVKKEDNIDAVTIRLQYSLCNGDPIDLLDQAHIVWPHPTNISIDTAICQDRSYSDEFVPFADTTGTYNVRIPDFRDCDSIIYRLNLKVLPRDTMHTDTTLCVGHYLDYLGLHTDQPGIYEVPLKYKGCDCDSVIHVIDMKQYDELLAAINDFPDLVCADDAVLSFLLNSTIPGSHYNVHFVPSGMGLEDITDAVSYSSDVLVRTNGNVYPGEYTMYLEVENETCGSVFDSIHFTVNYPAYIAPQKWGNVLVLLNGENNGGYNFSHIQWYRDGEAIEGANGAYFYAGEDDNFSPDAVYTVGLTRVGEDYEIQSCPLGDFATDVDDLQLNPDVLPMHFDGRMVVYDALGRVLANEAYDYGRLSNLISSSNHGVYLVKVYSQKEYQIYKILHNK